MKSRVYVIIGLILGIIGTAGGLYAGSIAVNSAVKPTEFGPAKAGWGSNMEFVEIGFIWIGIIGYGALIHGMVNNPAREVASKSYR
jgi:hypothetical protein